MKIDEYKLVLEISTLDKTFQILDLSTKICTIQAGDVEEYRIRYNGEDLCSGSLYDTFVSMIFDGNVYQLDYTNELCFIDIVKEVLSIINLNLFNIEIENKRFSKYKMICTTLIDGAKTPTQDHTSHE